MLGNMREFSKAFELKSKDKVELSVKKYSFYSISLINAEHGAADVHSTQVFPTTFVLCGQAS